MQQLSIGYAPARTESVRLPCATLTYPHSSEPCTESLTVELNKKEQKHDISLKFSLSEII